MIQTFPVPALHDQIRQNPRPGERAVRQVEFRRFRSHFPQESEMENLHFGPTVRVAETNAEGGGGRPWFVTWHREQCRLLMRRPAQSMPTFSKDSQTDPNAQTENEITSLA